MLARKSLLLAGKWPDRDQSFTRWSAGKPASRMYSKSTSKVTWYAHFFWILGMSYCVIDGLVIKFLQYVVKYFLATSFISCVLCDRAARDDPGTLRPNA